MKQIVICGTGQCGSSFLVALLRSCEIEESKLMFIDVFRRVSDPEKVHDRVRDK